MLSTSARPKPKPVKTPRGKPRKKVSARKLLERQLDFLCREIVLDRDLKCVCLTPSKGHSDVLQAGHLISRTKESVKWDLYNLSCQCASCNLLHEFFPHRYINWFLGAFGVESYSRLCQDAEVVKKLQLYELQELLDQMKKIRARQLVEALAGNPWKPRFTQAEILSGAWKK